MRVTSSRDDGKAATCVAAVESAFAVRVTSSDAPARPVEADVNARPHDGQNRLASAIAASHDGHCTAGL
jgi:hypothetical protein